MLTENSTDLLVWVIKGYLLITLLIQQYMAAKKGKKLEMQVQGLMKMKTMAVIVLVLLAILWFAIENVSLMALGVIFGIYLIQPRKIHENGVNIKGVFYEWDKIERIVLVQNSTSLRIYLKRRDLFLRKMLILPFLPQEREEVLKIIRKKPVPFENQKK